MKKGDIIIVLVALILMAGMYLGYKIFTGNLGDLRHVVVRYEKNEIYEIELTEETNLEIVVSEGEILQKIDRNKEPDKKINYENLEHYNVIRIYNNGVKVIDADCPSQDDVRKGFTNRLFDIIVCVPHRLEVEIIASENTNDTELDGVVG